MNEPVHDHTPVPLFLGAQQRLTSAQLPGLQIGDVIVVDDAVARRLDLRIDASASVLASPRLAVVNDHDGRVEHLSPGSWDEFRKIRVSGNTGRSGGGAAVAVDIVMGRMTLRAYECSALALGKCIADWGRVSWLDDAELRVCGRTLGAARAVMVAGYQGYKVTRLSSGFVNRHVVPHRRPTPHGKVLE